jgi:hypothetical protein
MTTPAFQDANRGLQTFVFTVHLCAVVRGGGGGLAGGLGQLEASDLSSINRCLQISDLKKTV